MSASSPNGTTTQQIRLIPLTYHPSESETSALRLVLALRPSWSSPSSKIEFIRFTDGITNTLLKAVNKTPGLSAAEIDDTAILLRAYGKGTDLLIDRERETQNHELLMGFGLAPRLLARFCNGMLYEFIQGRVTQPADLRQPPIYLAVARKLAEWHARVPCLPGRRPASLSSVEEILETSDDAPNLELTPSRKDPAIQAVIDNIVPGKLAPNVWSVMQKWILAMPTETEAQSARQDELQMELDFLVRKLGNRKGLGENSLVFAHCDLLSGNVIILPPHASKSNDSTAIASPPTSSTICQSVSFIDYEYATPSPAAFDIANHFAEWGGFECDYEVLPTRRQRREFIEEYIRSYFSLVDKDELAEERGGSDSEAGELDLEKEAEILFEEVDLFRGVPGLYWGIWALIQATISQIDFDYAAYAEVRLGEYRVWKEVDASKGMEKKLELEMGEMMGREMGDKMVGRERRWGTEG